MSEKSDRLIRVAGVIEKMELQTAATLMREIAEEHVMLLAALQVVLRDFKTVYDIGDLEMQPALFYANKAIARATGETQ